MACGGTSDCSETSEGLRLVVSRDIGVEVIFSSSDLRTNRADPACVGVNHTRANCNASGQAELCRSFLAKVAGKFTSREVFAILRSS